MIFFQSPFVDSNSFITTFLHDKYFIALIILSSSLTLVRQVEMYYMLVLLNGGGGVFLTRFPRLLRLPLSRNTCALPSRDTFSLLFRLCLPSPPPVTSSALLPVTRALPPPVALPVMLALAPLGTPPLASSRFSCNCGARPLWSHQLSAPPVTPVQAPSGNAGAPRPVMPAPATIAMPAPTLSRYSGALRSGHGSARHARGRLL